MNLPSALALRAAALYRPGDDGDSRALDALAGRLLACVADIHAADELSCDRLADALVTIRESADAALELLRPAVKVGV